MTKNVYLALLYSNNISTGIISPAKILMSGKLRTTLSCKTKSLRPKLVKDYDGILEKRQYIQKKYYNTSYN